jgi:Mn2+/Fe2+ NRAMP family transporter
VKDLLKLGLGIVTSIAGFIEVGSLSTSAQAGSQFGFRLLWAIAIATLCLIFLCEMGGRLAAVSKHPVVAGVRERFGIRYQAIPLTGEILLDVLVLTAEIGGVCIALQLLTGLPFQVFALPVVFLVWLLLWKGKFSALENGISGLGLVSLAFVVGAFHLKPDWGEVMRGFVPSLPGEEPARYGFLAVSILGATISPYLVHFYSSGAVEDHWGEKDLAANRVTAGFGLAFGSTVSMGVLVVSALVLAPRGIRVESFEQAALMLSEPFGRWGLPLFAAALAIGCLGAAIEVSLNLGYVLSQAFGWEWGEDLKPHEDSRFCTVYTVALVVAALPMLAGIPPLRVTMFAMALTVLVLPFIVFPFLVLMNDPHYLKTHRNGFVGNAVVLLIVAMGALLALVVIPLQIAGG